MARHTTITDNQILDAAREVFLEEGFNAPTSRIAALAGVSEGSVFKRFATKEALFFAAMDIPEQPQWHVTLGAIRGKGDPRANLEQVCLEILEHVAAMLPRFITRVGSKVGAHPMRAFEGMPEPPPVRDRRVLAEYLDFEAKMQRIMVKDSGTTAAMVLGTIMHHTMAAFTSQTVHEAGELDRVAQNIVDVLWNGIAPDNSQVLLNAGDNVPPCEIRSDS